MLWGLVPASADRACDDGAIGAASEMVRDVASAPHVWPSSVMREHQLIRKASQTIFLKGC